MEGKEDCFLEECTELSRVEKRDCERLANDYEEIKFRTQRGLINETKKEGTQVSQSHKKI